MVRVVLRTSHWSGKLQTNAKISSLLFFFLLFTYFLSPSSCHHRKHKAATAEEQSSGSRPSCSFCPFLEVLYLHRSQCQPLFQAILTTVIERHLRELILEIQVFGDKLAFLLTIGTLWISLAVKSSVPGVTSPCPVRPRDSFKNGLTR